MVQSDRIEGTTHRPGILSMQQSSSLSKQFEQYVEPSGAGVCGSLGGVCKGGCSARTGGTAKYWSGIAPQVVCNFTKLLRTSPFGQCAPLRVNAVRPEIGGPARAAVGCRYRAIPRVSLDSSLKSWLLRIKTPRPSRQPSERLFLVGIAQKSGRSLFPGQYIQARLKSGFEAILRPWQTSREASRWSRADAAVGNVKRPRRQLGYCLQFNV